MNRESVGNALRRIVGTLLPIAALATGVYLVYHAHRLDGLLERDERAVVSMRKQVGDRIDATATVIATRHRTLSRTDAVKGPSWPANLWKTGRIGCRLKRHPYTLKRRQRQS